MSRIRGLELLFNLESKNFKSKEDCVVAVFHCLLINEGLQCVGTGESWPDSNPDTTELLPKGWNSSQDAYSLRYTSKDNKTRILLKMIKMEHILQVHVVLNEEAVANMAVPVGNYISDQYNEYSTAYKDLESLVESFRKDVMEKLQPKPTKDASTGESSKNIPSGNPPNPPAPCRPFSDSQSERDTSYGFRFPRVGGSDLNPFVSGGGGMLMDPSGFGIPARPTRGGRRDPFGLPSGVPPGARFDPFGPPIIPSNPFRPSPDHFKPPDFDDFL